MSRDQSDAALGQRARLFAAVWLPPAAVAHLRAALQPVRSALATEQRSEPRLTRPETWHVTLAFLGEADLAGAQRRFAQVALPAAGVLQVAGVGRFGAITWAGVRHGPWLAESARALQAGLGVADRRFKAHVTVARDRRRSYAADSALNPVLAALGDYEGPAWQPRQVLLVRSVLGPHSRYEPVAQRSLTPPN